MFPVCSDEDDRNDDDDDNYSLRQHVPTCAFLMLYWSMAERLRNNTDITVPG